MRTAFEYEGEVRGIDLLACLVTLWRESASGSLQFSRSGATAGFDIAIGEIAATSSSADSADSAGAGSVSCSAGPAKAPSSDGAAAAKAG